VHARFVPFFSRSFLVCLLTYTLLWNGKYVSISCLLSAFRQGCALNFVFPAVVVVAVPGFIELLFLPGDLSPLIGNRYPRLGCDYYFFDFLSLGLWWKGGFLFAVLAADENGKFEGCLCFLRFLDCHFGLVMNVVGSLLPFSVCVRRARQEF
jgi:hypothetical protein